MSNGRRILHIHLQILVQIFFNYTRTRYISSLILSIKFKNVSHEKGKKKRISSTNLQNFLSILLRQNERIGMFDRWIEFTPPGAWHAADGPDTRSDIPVSYFSRVFLPAIL